MADRLHPPCSPWTDLRWVLPAGGRTSARSRSALVTRLRTLGLSMVASGILIVLFTAYQLWGTGLVEWQAQRALEAELAATFTSSGARQSPGEPAVGAPDSPSLGDGAPGLTAPTIGAGSESAAAASKRAALPVPIAAPGAGQRAALPAPITPLAAGQPVTPPGPAAPTAAGQPVQSTGPAAPTAAGQPVQSPGPAAPSAAEPLAAAPAAATAVEPVPAPREGDALARLDLPTIGVSKVIVQGVERDTLRQGPGHYPSSALPGQVGNVAIAGHRTTHGAPFFDLDLLSAGDEITLETDDGVLVYEVQGHTGTDGKILGHQIVDPAAVEVIADHGDDRLTLTACHPKFSAKQRIVVSALLVSGRADDLDPAAVAGTAATGSASSPAPAPASPRLPMTASEARARHQPATMSAVADRAAPSPHEPAPASPDETVVASPDQPATMSAVADRAALSLDEPALASPDETAEASQGGPADAALRSGPVDDSLGWQRSELDPTTLWATVFVLVVFGTWIMGRLLARRAVYAAAAPLALIPLALCYYHLERLLPAF